MEPNYDIESLINKNIDFFRNNAFTPGKKYTLAIDIKNYTFIEINKADLSSKFSLHKIIGITINPNNEIKVNAVTEDVYKTELSEDKIMIIQKVFQKSLEHLARTPALPLFQPALPAAAGVNITIDPKLINDIEEIFGKVPDLDIANLFQHILNLTKKRLETNKPLTRNEIFKIYHIFFSEIFKKSSENIISMDKKVSCTQALSSVTLFHRLYQAMEALKEGDRFIPISEVDETAEQTSEAYVLKNSQNVNLWIFKPIDGEVIKRVGIRPGEGAIRELACSRLNLAGNFSLVPYTILIEINGKRGSLQYFVPSGKNILMEEELLDEGEVVLDRLDKFNLQKCLIFDLLFSNTDRNKNNILVKPILGTDKYSFYAIDNGTCLSQSLKDLLVLELVESNQTLFPLDPSLASFIDSKTVTMYISILSELGFHGDSLKWCGFCAEFLGIGIESKLLVKDLVYLLRDLRNILLIEKDRINFFKFCIQEILFFRKTLNEKKSEMDIDLYLTSRKTTKELENVIIQLFKEYRVRNNI